MDRRERRVRRSDGSDAVLLKSFCSDMRRPVRQDERKTARLFIDRWKAEYEGGVECPNKDLPKLKAAVKHGRNYVKPPPGPTETPLSRPLVTYYPDRVDKFFVDRLNKQAGRNILTMDQLSQAFVSFEMDYLKSQKEKDASKMETDEGERCSVCNSPHPEEGNELVFCDNCNVCVHQACYGVSHIPDGQWYCDPCSKNVTPKCVLCNNSGGAYKLVSNTKRWVHVSCALWTPGISFANPSQMGPVYGLENVMTGRYTCSLCERRDGAAIKCSKKHCTTRYHVTCAIKAQLYMEHRNVNNSLELVSMCIEHGKKRPLNASFFDVTEGSLVNNVSSERGDPYEYKINTNIPNISRSNTLALLEYWIGKKEAAPNSLEYRYYDDRVNDEEVKPEATVYAHSVDTKALKKPVLSELVSAFATGLAQVGRNVFRRSEHLYKQFVELK